MLNFLRPRQGGAGAGQISGADAVAEHSDGNLTIVDVRDQGEIVRTGKAKGALHIPLSVLRFQSDPRNPDFHPELKIDKPVAIYCASGARSGIAARVMSQMGFSDVANLGNLNNWVAGGGEVVRN